MQKRSPDRSAGPLRWLGAALTGLLPTPTTPAQINPGLSLWLDEKRGSRHDAAPIETVALESAAEVMNTIPKLLARHPNCFRIHVHARQTHLFSVDCGGRRVDTSVQP